MSTHPVIEPWDEHNRQLVANVHPPGWNNPAPRNRYHLVVIGAGTAGLVAAAGAAALGAKVALVEKHLMGGDCLNAGCVPSKTLIRAAHAAHEARQVERFGIDAGPVSVNFAAVMDRVRAVRAAISPHDSAARFRELGVDVFLGAARFSAPDAVEVDGAKLRFRKAVLCTGTSPAIPEVPGLATAGFLTNESVFNLTTLPRRLAVIGGGPVGCELAQAFQRLGAGVILFQDQPQLLGREDEDAASLLQTTLSREGIKVFTSAVIDRVETAGNGRRLHGVAGGKQFSVVVDEILVAAGRTANVAGLNLESAEIRHDARGGVAVDDRLRTSNPRIYAAGDVCMEWKFTHAADFAARIVIQNALFLGRKRLSTLTIPWCTYTRPEIARVGLSEREAGERGIRCRVFVQPLARVDRAIIDGASEGFVKILVRSRTDEIVGASIVAPHAGELISEIAVAMRAKLGLGRLAGVVHPYPTMAEAIRKCGDACNRDRLTPPVKGLIERWLRWTL